jgi:hypothetical protein
MRRHQHLAMERSFNTAMAVQRKLWTSAKYRRVAAMA